MRIPRELVDRARDTAPPMIPVYDRDGELAMQLGGRNAYFGTGSDLMNTYDLETGERRPSVLADVRRMARLCDALPNIDFVMSSAYPSDVAAHASYLESFRAMAGNTTKPLVVTAAEADDLEVMWRIACELRGGAEGLRARPYFIHYGEPVSPLKHPVEVLDKLLLCADHGIPLVYAPAPTAGAAAPITPAGQIMQGVAESLFGLVIRQLRRPGAPFITGSASAKLDMTTLRQLYNSAERYSTDLGIIEMAKWMDIPNWSFAGTSDSQCVDAQAGIDATQVTLLSMQAGANLNHDLGYLDAGAHLRARTRGHRRRDRLDGPPRDRRRRGQRGDARRGRRRRGRPRRRLPEGEAYEGPRARSAVETDHVQSRLTGALGGRGVARPAREGATQGARDPREPRAGAAAGERQEVDGRTRRGLRGRGQVKGATTPLTAVR